MATSFDMGLLGDLFGGGGETGLEGYLTPAQQAAMRQQGLLQAALAIGQASGPSTTPRSLMQILGSGVAAGQQGYAEAQKNAITNLLTKQKMDEYKRQLAQQEAYQRFIMGQPTEGMEISPQQAISAPGMSVGPTVQRAEMIGQPAPRVSPTGAANLSPQMRQLLAALPAKEGIPEALKFMQPPKTVGAPYKGADGKYYIQTETGGAIPAPVTPADMGAEEYGLPTAQVVNGQTQMVQYNKYGQPRVVPGATPYEPSPAEVKLLREAGVPVTMENIMAIRKSATSQTTNILNAEKKGVELAYENAVKDLGISRDMARAANSTIANVERILPALDTAITGPAADTRTTFLRIGKQLNIAGENADQVLKNTAIVVQGLAQQELSAAEQMRGQGALTEGERAILRRAAGGDQSLTAGELRVGLLAAQRVARMRAESHGQLLQTAVKSIPALSSIAPMYEVPVYGAQAPNPLPNLIQQELDRRRSQGGRR